MKRFAVEKVVHQGDMLELRVSESDESLLILSQKYHRDWRADALVGGDWVDAQTLPVNDVFQGIMPPAAAQRVVLRFEPFVRFAWVSHVFFAVLLVIAGLNSIWPRVKISVAASGAFRA